jgi:DNA-binding XRE family transcriptional regulator
MRIVDCLSPRFVARPVQTIQTRSGVPEAADLARVLRISTNRKISSITDNLRLSLIRDNLHGGDLPMDNTLLLQTPTQLPEHLKALRKARRLTQAQLAARLHIGQSRYAFIENHPESVSTAQLLDVFAALGVDILLRLRSARLPSARSRGGEDW